MSSSAIAITGREKGGKTTYVESQQAERQMESQLGLSRWFGARSIALREVVVYGSILFYVERFSCPLRELKCARKSRREGSPSPLGLTWVALPGSLQVVTSCTLLGMCSAIVRWYRYGQDALAPPRGRS